MGEKKTGKSKDKVSKASYYQRPGNMTLEQWQIALRRQIVAKEHFGIQEMDAKEYPGYYTVHNPVSRNDYRVVYRGEASEWNYCSCMDFKASRLGTCKHLEAVRLWLEKSGKKAFTGTPPYTSVYLSYRHGREVRLRIGTEHAGEFRALARALFHSQVARGHKPLGRRTGGGRPDNRKNHPAHPRSRQGMCGRPSPAGRETPVGFGRGEVTGTDGNPCPCAPVAWRLPQVGIYF